MHNCTYVNISIDNKSSKCKWILLNVSKKKQKQKWFFVGFFHHCSCCLRGTTERDDALNLCMVLCYNEFHSYDYFNGVKNWLCCFFVLKMQLNWKSLNFFIWATMQFRMANKCGWILSKVLLNAMLFSNWYLKLRIPAWHTWAESNVNRFEWKRNDCRIFGRCIWKQ